MSLPCLIPIPPVLQFPRETAQEYPVACSDWMGIPQSDPVLQGQRGDILTVGDRLEQAGVLFSWGAMSQNSVIGDTSPCSDPPLTRQAKVLAIVPHYCCETWLERCLRSLLSQTRPPDHIIVIDDHSPHPPQTLINNLSASITLLLSPENVGPYRLIQQVINDTEYDAYLFQDADDWSANNRLEKLLLMAEQTGAELIGSQEWRVYPEQSSLIPIVYPLDVNLALISKPGHPLLHPSSLVSRTLVQRIGGFATGLRFGGDTEFLLRAVWCSKIVNLPEFCYFRRKRPYSLTTALETGLDSPARQALLKALKQRFRVNLMRNKAGIPLDLEPISTAPSIELQFNSSA